MPVYFDSIWWWLYQRKFVPVAVNKFNFSKKAHIGFKFAHKNLTRIKNKHSFPVAKSYRTKFPNSFILQSRFILSYWFSHILQLLPTTKMGHRYIYIFSFLSLFFPFPSPGLLAVFAKNSGKDNLLKISLTRNIIPTKGGATPHPGAHVQCNCFFRCHFSVLYLTWGSGKEWTGRTRLLPWGQLYIGCRDRIKDSRLRKVT